MKKIVGVSSCSMGIAHTYMAAENIEKYFSGLGYTVKMERDGSMGPENIISAEEIKEADIIILALSGDLNEPERFESYEKKTVRVTAVEGLRKPQKILERMKEKGLA